MKITKVLNVINNGGFGIIEKVECDDGNHYARKTFNPSSQFQSDLDLCDKLKHRFIREVVIQKSLPQEYFIPIIHYNITDKNPWFLMPIAEDIYVDEIKRSKDKNKIPEGLADILNSLEYIHSRDLVHRDLKPQNILKHDGIWKLADFGLITQDKEILSQTITTSNNAFGTIHYCAPEQTTDFRRVTAHADIYSFGAILHDIFTDGKRVPYSELTTNGEIGIVIEKCTKHKKELRFKDIKTLRNKLLYVLSKKPTASNSEQDQEWIDKFNKCDTWNEDIFENFIFYLRKSVKINNIFFIEVDLKKLNSLFKIDKELFDTFSMMYFDWVYKAHFEFDYCDVVIGYLEDIYKKVKDLEVKARVVIVAAQLATSHNRYYVMRRVISMSNEDISDNLAYRIGIEIELDEKNKRNFLNCVEKIDFTIKSYHQDIERLLDDDE